tara:strand:- start:70 stop:243 length:174 start_codon:yes stop_codon:yes gene_type:complete
LSITDRDEEIPFAIESETSTPLRTSIAPIPECVSVKQFFDIGQAVVLETSPNYSNIS